MPNYLPLIKKEMRPNLQVLISDLKANRQKDYFRPHGTQIYVGRQGSGKTIASVYHVLTLLEIYPKAKLVTNLKLNIEQEYTHFSTVEELAELLVNVNNNEYGVIYLIDEIHLYFNALGSLNVPMYVFTEISQQRKQRKVIIGTSQLFMRTAKPIREQGDNIIKCSTIGGVFTITKAYDAESVEVDPNSNGKLLGQKRKTGWFMHTLELRGAFDTFQKVISGADMYNVEQNNKIIEPIPVKIQKTSIFKR